MRLDLYPLEKAEDEMLLVRTAEECAEVILAIAKCQRFGLGNHHPDRPNTNNISELREEMKDVELCFAEIKRRML